MNRRLMMWMRGALALLCGLLLLAAALVAVDARAQEGGGGPGIDWWVVAGGGGPAADSGGVALDATLGQPIAGPAGSGSLALGAGYWYGTLRPPAVDGYWIYLPLAVKRTAR